MKRKIEQEHIDNGKCGQPGECALALLLKECYPGESKFHVNAHPEHKVTDVWVGNHRLMFENDKKVFDFIIKFDNDKSKVKPFFVEWEDF